MKEQILNDDVINSFDDDLLNREPFVENLSDSLLSCNPKTSLVIGLFGKWGSGKTSIINLLERQLRDDIFIPPTM